MNPRPSVLAKMVTMRVKVEMSIAVSFVMPCASPV